jgi:heme-degrading monooxygenase HmoA
MWILNHNAFTTGTVLYWDSEEQIRAWKQDPEHLAAQRAWRDRWYKSYRVEIVETRRSYTYPSPK